MKILGYLTLLPFLLMIIGAVFHNLSLISLGFSLIPTAIIVALGGIPWSFAELKLGGKPSWNMAAYCLTIIISVLMGLYFVTTPLSSM